MKVGAKQLQSLAMSERKNTRGMSHDGTRMEARRCPVCFAYEVVDIDGDAKHPNRDNTILSCKCDI